MARLRFPGIAAALLWAGAPVSAQTSEPPLLMVLMPTGQVRDDLPVFTPHADPEPYLDTLGRGFSGRLLRSYRLVQQFLEDRDGRPAEPAYLLLSNRQGGFARAGFWLDDTPKPVSGYVDLHRDRRPSGHLGAVDQIFPHELLHVLVNQLAGPPPRDAGGANQVHAVGVRTDRVTAFNEGFAEVAQILALDDPDAVPDTAGLAVDAGRRRRTSRQLAAYRRALAARWAPAPPARLAFPLWFSQAEDTLRVEFVKDNLFARRPAIPERLLNTSDPYAAYLLENVLPGQPDDPVGSTSRLLATEGVVASILWRWVTSDVADPVHHDVVLFERFGAGAAHVDPVSRALLKIFAVLAGRSAHDLVSLTAAYVSTFPEDSDRLGAIVRESHLPWPLPAVPEIWLANDRFMTGTTVFDQFRALPRVHTFDLNAASVVDLMGVDGMTADTARAIVASAPYGTLDDVAGLPEVPSSLAEELGRLALLMDDLRASRDEESVESLSLMTIFQPYLTRAVIWLITCAAAAALVYRFIRRVSAWRVLLAGLLAAVSGLGSTWLFAPATGAGAGLLWPFVPLAILGVPAMLWQVVWHRANGQPAQVLAAWALACVPALLVTRAW